MGLIWCCKHWYVFLLALPKWEKINLGQNLNTTPTLRLDWREYGYLHEIRYRIIVSSTRVYYYFFEQPEFIISLKYGRLGYIPYFSTLVGTVDSFFGRSERCRPSTGPWTRLNNCCFAVAGTGNADNGDGCRGRRARTPERPPWRQQGRRTMGKSRPRRVRRHWRAQRVISG